MQGQLSLYQGVLNIYKPRYCVLDNEVLTVFNNKGGDARAKIHLGVYSIQSDNNKKILTLDNGLQTIEFKAETLSSVVLWTNKLKEAKRKFMDRTLNRSSTSEPVADSDSEEDSQEYQESETNDPENIELKTRLSEVWSLQAVLTEAMNELFIKMPRHTPFVKTAKTIDKLGKNLKVSQHNCFINQLNREISASASTTWSQRRKN